MVSLLKSNSIFFESKFWDRIDENDDYDKFGITYDGRFAYTIAKKMEAYNFGLMIFDHIC